MNNTSLKSRFVAEKLPTDEICRQLIATYVDEIATQRALQSSKRKDYTSVLCSEPFWSHSSEVDVSAPLGFDDAGRLVELRFGDEIGAHHALIGGRTGSGKSNLLHVILHSLCWRYSPKELELYLLDYKDGIEFSRYAEGARSWLPQARLISAHNDPMYALSVFDGIKAEWQLRSRKFKANGCAKLTEFRRKCREPMPRMLIVIDEFQKMLEDPATAEMIGAELLSILTQGRAFGTHLILATQTLESIDVSKMPSMLSQLTIRLALAGRESDRILEMGNTASEELDPKLTPRQCVFNDKAGKKSGNRIFAVPYIDFDGEKDCVHLQLKKKILSASTGGNTTENRCKIFNGMELPIRSLVSRSSSDRLEIDLGLSNDFESGRVVASFNEDSEGHLLIMMPPANARDLGDMSTKEAVDGLRASIVQSLQAQGDNAEVLYYKASRENATNLKALPKDWNICPPESTEDDLYRSLEKLSKSQKKYRIFVIDGFEAARMLHQDSGRTHKSDLQSRLDTVLLPFNSAEFSSRLQEANVSLDKNNVASLFSKAFSEGERLPFHVVLLMRVGNFGIVRRDILEDNIIQHCSMRVLVNMPGDVVDWIFLERANSTRRNLKGLVLYGCQDDVRSFLPYRA